MAALSLRIPEGLQARLEIEARREGVPRSEVARAAIEEFLTRRERERYLAAFVAEARASYGDTDAREEMRSIADEALPFDNEALELAEARSSRLRIRRSKRRTNSK